MIDSMTATAAKDGITMRFDIAQSGNTFDAHRLVHLAEQHGKGDAAKERLFRAYMTEGQNVGDPDTLVRLGAELGLPEADVQLAIESGAFTPEVRADESEARELGISGVPFFVFAGKYGVSGAQPAEALLQVLTKVWAELPEQPAVAVVADGAVCGPDGCA
jgi:predicted DsbA family dithiol-disulfide isomerase